MSIWPQVIPKARPSRAIDFVRPVMACLVAVYGAELGRGVCAEIEPLLMMRPPRGILSLHQSHRPLGTQEGTGEVGVDGTPPLLEGQLVQRNCRGTDTGIVEQQIEPAEPLVDGCEQRVDTGNIADIGGMHHRVRRNQRSGLGEGIRTAAGQHDGEPICGQADGHGPPNAAPGTGHQCDSSWSCASAAKAAKQTSR